MKKSIFNIFKKINENKYAVFNSYSLVIAETDETFFKIYNNLNNFDLESLTGSEKETFDIMYNNNFIVDDETDELKNLEYSRLTKIADRDVFQLVIYPTLGCNFDCYYCYEKNKKGVITVEVQEKILALVKYHAGRKSDIKIMWHGGEPLLVFDIIYGLSKKIMEICRENNVNFSSELKSNGYLFNDDIIFRLKECSCSFIMVTVDGPPGIHNRIRYLKSTKEDTFDKILENIKKIKLSDIHLNIVVNINKKFSLDNLIEFVEILIDNGLEKNFCIYPEIDSNSGSVFSLNKNCLTNTEFAKFCMDFYERLYREGLGELVEKQFIPRIINNYCAATRFGIVDIDPDGYLYKCSLEVGMHDKAIGNILDMSGNNKVYYNNKVKYMTWNPFKFDKCRSCNIVPICMGNCPKKGMDSNEPYCKQWKFNIEEFIALAAGNKYKK